MLAHARKCVAHPLHLGARKFDLIQSKFVNFIKFSEVGTKSYQYVPIEKVGTNYSWLVHGIHFYVSIIKNVRSNF